MPVSQHLQHKLLEILGAHAAEDLVSMLDAMDASRGDVGELRHEMQLGFARIDARFAGIDARFEAMQASFERTLEKGLREQTRFFFLAWAVILAGIIGIYAR